MKFNTYELRRRLKEKGYADAAVDDIMERYVNSFKDPRLKAYSQYGHDKKKMVELACLCEEILHKNVPELYT